MVENQDIGSQFITQLIGVVAVGVFCGVVTWIIVMVVKQICGLRVSDDEETEGLDTSVHGEKGYRL